MLASCADLTKTRDVRVTIVNERGEPISGAIFYVEAADDRGAFAFLWARSGLAGEVPQSAREPLELVTRQSATRPSGPMTIWMPTVPPRWAR